MAPCDSAHNDVEPTLWECASADGCVRLRRMIRPSNRERAIIRDFGKL